MIHARTDYDRIQDPAVENPALLAPGCSPIAPDDPVFLIRAGDRCSTAALHAWANHLDRMGGDPEIADHVRDWAERMADWRREHGGKVPDAPHNVLRELVE